MFRRHSLPVAGLAALAALLLAAPAWAARVVDVRVGTHPEFTRVVFELDQAAGYRVERIGGDDSPALRVTVDAASQAEQMRSGGDIRKVEVEGGAQAVTHIDLRRPGLRLREMILANPPRIVLDVMRPKSAASRSKPRGEAVAANEAAPKAAPKAEPKPAPKASPPKPIAVAEPTPEPPEVARVEKPVEVAPVEKSPAEVEVAPEELPRVVAEIPEIESQARPEAESAIAALDATPEALADSAPESALEESAAAASSDDSDGIDDALEDSREETLSAFEREMELAQREAGAELPGDPSPEATQADAGTSPIDPTGEMGWSERLRSDSRLQGGLALGGLALAAIAFVLSRRRRALPNDLDVTAIADEEAAPDAVSGSGFGLDAEPSAEVDEEDDAVASLFDAPAPRSPDSDLPSESNPSTSGSTTALFGAAGQDHGTPEPSAPEPSVGDTPMDHEIDLPAARGDTPPPPPSSFAATPAPDADSSRMLEEMARRMSALEAKLDESNEAREKLERQVAAQSEELRVQRAAIARTQRALRTMSRGDEEKATEPALRESDPQK